MVLKCPFFISKILDGLIRADIDEYAIGTGEFSANGSCSNGYGVFSCSCNAGFSGDGIDWNDVDECAQGIDNCDAESELKRMHLVSTALELSNVNAKMITLETESLSRMLTGVLLTLTIVMRMLHAVMKSETRNSGFNRDGTNCEDVDEAPPTEHYNC